MSMRTMRSLGRTPYPFGRTAGYGVDDDDRVAQDVELHADAAELAVEARGNGLHLLGIEVGRMGVQFVEHALDGLLHERRHLDLVDVVAGQEAVDLHEFLQLRRRIGVLRRKGSGAQERHHQQPGTEQTAPRAAPRPRGALRSGCRRRAEEGV
ncbi:MAG: hypothetical protein V8Q28_06435 [Alistipes sp.]